MSITKEDLTFEGTYIEPDISIASTTYGSYVVCTCMSTPCTCAYTSYTTGSTSTTYTLGVASSTTGYISVGSGSAWSPTITLGDYTFEEKDKTLYIKCGDEECLSIKDGTILLNGQSIYELMFEMLSMSSGQSNALSWLTDKNEHKRAIAGKLHKLQKANTKKKSKSRKVK